MQQNNLIKAREEKYQSRIKVLETLASGTSEETQVFTDMQLHLFELICKWGCNRFTIF